MSQSKRCEPAPWIEIGEDRPRPLSKLLPAKAFHDTLTVGALCERHYPTHQASRSLHAKGSKGGECQFTSSSSEAAIMKMIPMCDGHICLMKTRRDGTVICSSRISNRVDAMPMPLTFMSL